jgi:uncharacterized protein YbjT (DUF2867 family)
VTILVTGATGLVGRLLIDELAGRGAEVRAVTRRPGAVTFPAGVTVAEGFAGVDAVFLHPRAVADPAGFLARARAGGVPKVVALSAMNVDDPLDEQPSRTVGDRNKEAEDAAVASGMSWTSLRPSSFASNTARSFGPAIRAGDVVRYVYPGFSESLLHERDLAAVAAHALLGDELTGRRIELTGPHALSHTAMVATIGAVLGRPLRFVEIAPETAIRAMTAAGMPEAFGTALMQRYARYPDKPQHPVTDAVATILHRTARTYTEWVTENAHAFR